MNCFEFTVYCSFISSYISIMLMFLLYSFFLSSYLFQFQEGNSVTSWIYSQNDRNNILQSYSAYSTLDSDQYYLLSFINSTDIELKGPQKEPLYWDWNFFDKLKHEDKYLEYLKGNLLITGYLETYKEPCLWCIEGIDDLTEEDYFTYLVISAHSKTSNKEEKIGIIKDDKEIGTVLHEREKDLSHFWKEAKDIRSLLNDGKVHTLHVIIDDQWSQDLWYLIADWDIVD